MKLLTSLIALVGFTSAQLIIQGTDSLSEPDYCDTTTLSCHWTGSVDACCSPKYGLVVLALQWMPGFGPNDEFTIHGLWPDTCSGRMAPGRGCDNSRNTNQIASIVRNMNSTMYGRMNTFWPSNKGDNNWFWSHEWTKHGTCVSTLRPTCYGPTYKKYQDVIEYFEQVLDLRDRFDLFGALNLNGVSPGRHYNVETIRDAIKSTYGANVKLDCHGNQLSEISLNFYVRGRDKYEITNVQRAGNCRGAVYYPKK
ncbi:base non specific RNase Rh [Mucor mucedo]|uniref:ribonuclease T2 n=1 Tax=Mucor saturninus TaxID=64648 RepID=A0A8H7QMG7_9FUNG|nr:base non specific RNase Rh [Mucor mucedo]KAG2195374.1 hypothetical protein INT47_004482 [Mucor saturninus]KAI7888043.1 base non specific RNase Rh [Mucor mucedo]